MMGHESGHGSHTIGSESAIEILRRRFSAGEITPEPDEEMERVILGDGTPGHGSLPGYRAVSGRRTRRGLR